MSAASTPDCNLKEMIMTIPAKLARSLLHLCLFAGAPVALAVVPAQAADPSWFDPKLAEAAKKEATLVIYSSVNEEEGLPIWKKFEEQTGVRIEYVRGSDSQLIARMAIESRAGRPAWDLTLITAAHKLPPAMLAQIDPPEAQHLFPAARDPNRRWYGFSANYNVPAYNTNLVKAADLPQSYEELARRGEWAGRVVVNQYDSEWVVALLEHYGDSKGREILRSLGATLKPAIVDGHLAVARAVGNGEYAVALTNYVNLTMNVKLSGAPTDYWAIDPVGVFYMQVSASAQAPHPNAARLGANFILSKEGQSLLTARGRVPSRADVETNPPGVLKAMLAKKVVPISLDPEQEKKADAIFKELIAGRAR
ncbi:MAG: iron(III) transport system substrate-binding protein [Alphaproteobacteria bacterium]|jgi:iron(III) transport system substrate-binding protein|nr:iron(III) transport system substrate-binding protein [Alphaproteobacteria bacterium]